MLVLVLAGMLGAAAAVLGLVPATPPRAVAALIAAFAVAKAAAAAGGVVARVTGRA